MDGEYDKYSAEDLLRELLTKHFYSDRLGLTYSYREGVAIREIAPEAFEKRLLEFRGERTK